MNPATPAAKFSRRRYNVSKAGKQRRRDSAHQSPTSSGEHCRPAALTGGRPVTQPLGTAHALHLQLFYDVTALTLSLKRSSAAGHKPLCLI